ncbi:MAG: DNA sulfur modification protein DndD [Gammaproteobacteria bacterium]|nr:DNA sulfur modification protein DndD [Gammaproteobacteria bacterium]MCY4228470.1 DNA sulfur modification protein DndD [Gammaproteobacteria bacterium]
MILDEIVVHDYGLYAGRQKACLTPPSKEKPIILFGGLNGHGKTTLLDALQLSLYGPFAQISNRGDLSYSDYLARCIHRGALASEAAVEVAFHHTADGKEDNYRIHRSWRMQKSGHREHFEVYRNRKRDVTLEENWISHVEDLIPVNISSLFLFDGEQVERYASPENSVQLISTAIHNLLGLDIVNQLEKDLITFSRRKRAEDKNDPEISAIEEMEGQIRKMRKKTCDLKQERAALKSNHIDPARKLLSEIESKYRQIGGELYDIRTKIEKELEQAEQELSVSKEKLRSLASNELPLILVHELLKSTHNQVVNEESSRRSRIFVDLLDNRDQKILDMMRDCGADEGIVDSLFSKLKKDRDEHRKRGEQDISLDVGLDIGIKLNVLIDSRFNDLAEEVIKEMNNLKIANVRVEHARIQQSSIPTDDVISEIASRREAVVDEIASFEKENIRIEDEINQLNRRIENLEHSLLRAIESDIQAEGERQGRTRILDYSKQARTTLSTFRETVIARHVDRIENLVLESYQQLLRKTSLITSLTIDPQSFELTLCNGEGHKLSAECLSAGERQLLAIAMLWGLAKASGRILPTAIDTPLGRLDAGHRKYLVERYFPFASHQVLLFSTDEEIMGSYLDVLNPYIGRAYHLYYDDSKGSTQILNGYFDQRQAA